LVQGILASEQSRFESDELLHVCKYRQGHVAMSVPALQDEDRNSHRSKRKLYKV